MDRFDSPDRRSGSSPTWRQPVNFAEVTQGSANARYVAMDAWYGLSLEAPRELQDRPLLDSRPPCLPESTPPSPTKSSSPTSTPGAPRAKTSALTWASSSAGGDSRP